MVSICSSTFHKQKDIDPSWTGYKENDKELIAVILADAKNEESKSGNSPLGRKRTGIEASNDNDQHNSKRLPKVLTLVSRIFNLDHGHRYHRHLPKIIAREILI